MFEELVGHCLGVNSGSHVVMALVAEHADDFRSQSFIEHPDDGVAIGLVAVGHCATFDMLPCTASNFMDVSCEVARFFF